LWYGHKAREKYEIDRLQFQLAYSSQHHSEGRWWLDREEDREEAAKRDLQHQEDLQKDLRNIQTNWHSLISLIKFLAKLGMMVFMVLIICNIGEGRWGKPDFSKKDSFLQLVEKLASWLYGIIDYYAINYPIPYLIFRWAFMILGLAFIILGLYG